MAAWPGSLRATGPGSVACVAELQQESVEAAVAVILRQDGYVLLGQRPEGKSWAGWWEFPGGKIEQGESAAEALKREVHEELGVEAEDFSPWITREFSYPERHVRLNFFVVRTWRGEPHGKERQNLSWQNPANVGVGPLLPANVPVMQALQFPALYAITNLAEMGEQKFFRALGHALERGLKFIQIREKHLLRDALKAFAEKVVAVAHPYGARVVLNGDGDLAKSCGADGVHLSSSALSALATRPEALLCGASCHNAEELTLASSLNLDYVLLGPVQATKTHPDATPIGWRGFGELAYAQPMPVYALGGLTAADLTNAWRHGAHGVAMMRGIWS